MEKYDASPYTCNVIDEVQDNSIFKFQDTLTSRAEITDLSCKFNNETIAIIGLGGTGAYILDFMVKTPVKEIRGFDNDEYYVHNAYRSPGRLKSDELGKKKAKVYGLRYENFREGLVFSDNYIDSASCGELDGVTFAFVCVDKGPSRKEIIDLLVLLEIPFIDVGMGLKRKDGLLSGMARTTYFSPENAENVLNKGLVELNSDKDNLYKTNIQIAELNALNACMAVIKYKQLRGFYFEEDPSYHLLFDIQDMKIVGE